MIRTLQLRKVKHKGVHAVALNPRLPRVQLGVGPEPSKVRVQALKLYTLVPLGIRAHHEEEGQGSDSTMFTGVVGAYVFLAEEDHIKGV